MQRTPAPSTNPRLEAPWAEQIRRHYEAHASSQFILFGNIHDLVLLPESRFGTLHEGLAHLTQKFDLILSYRIDRGIWVEKGGETIAAVKEGWHPETAIPEIGRILRSATFARSTARQIAVIIHEAEKIFPTGQRGAHYELAHLVSGVRAWASDAQYREHPLATFLITENLAELHEDIVQNSRTVQIEIPVPGEAEVTQALNLWAKTYPQALPAADFAPLGRALKGVMLQSLEQEVKLAHHAGEALALDRVGSIKKRLVEREAGELLEFLQSRRRLADIAGLKEAKELIALHLAMWKQGKTQKFPKGYLLAGPVGTGKTYVVDCIAGEGAVPVVKLKNFRDMWYGKTEGNLEKAFRLIRALAPCIVFIDEADQSLGKRDSSANDGGLSGRIYSQFAQEMSDPTTRGQVLWILATSRPDLVEVDLKRPGRVDVKFALMPTGTPEESVLLLQALLKKEKLLTAEQLGQVAALQEKIPVWLTPGAAESLCASLYTALCAAEAEGRPADPLAELTRLLENYQAPVRKEVMEFQIRLAAAEATSAQLIPPAFREFR